MLSPSHDPRPTGGRTRPARLEICPPRRAQADGDWKSRVKQWFTAGWSGSAAADSVGSEASLALAAARQDFFAAVADLELPAAGTLLDRIEFARSLHELWHLRAEVFALVSLELSQLEADRRLATLNTHFTSRSPRSGFGGLPSTKGMWP